MMKKFTMMMTLLYLLSSPLTLAAEMPLSLTATDGTGLELQRLEARVVLDGLLAFTELELVFYNSENRRREGHFQIVLPDQATISRFAMKIGEELQEGEVVEKQLARRAYEDFLHRRQDPALLEMDQGNRFNARIFPIEPKAEKLLLLSYSQRLLDDYVLPLNGLPTLKDLSIKVFYDNATFQPKTTQLGQLAATVSKREVLTVEKRDYRPTDDFRMPYQPRQTNQLAMQHEQLIATKVIPFTETDTNDTTAATRSIDNLIVLLDTSASQSPFFSETLQRLETLLPQLRAKTVHFYTFDQEVIAVGTATTVAEQRQRIQSLRSYPILGASRLDTLVSTLSPLIKVPTARLLLISDAVVTAGETSPAVLARQFKPLPWLTRLDVLLPSYHSDKTLALALVKAGQTAGMVTTLSLSETQLVSKLTSPVYTDIPITITGAKWFWPERVEMLQTKEPLIIFAELNPDQREIAIQIAGKHLMVTAQSANPILLKREWVKARLDKLLQLEDTASEADLKSAFHHEIINLSVQERVLSPYTSLLVLETEADYQRYQIDRRSLANILTVGIDGLTVIKRAGRGAVEPPPPPVIEERPLPMRKTETKNRPQPSNGEGTTGSALPSPAPTVAMRSRQTATEMGRADMKEKKEKANIEEPPVKIIAPESEVAEPKDTKVTETAPMETTTANVVAAPALQLAAPAEMLVNKPVDSTAETEADNQKESVADEAVPEALMASPQSNEAVAAPATAMDNDRAMAVERAAEVVQPMQAAEMRISETAPANESTVSPWTGRYAEFRTLLDRGDLKAAGKLVQTWRQTDLSEVMALIAWGEWAEKTGELTQAARAYGSLIDYFPARADIRRWAAERLLASHTATWLSIDSLKTAVTQRPDHPSGHYLLAMAYWDAGQVKAAIETLQAALQRQFDPRFAQITRILEETLALLLTTLSDRQQLGKIWSGQSFHWEKVSAPQLRFVMMWETDANDVDFHLYDGKQNHAFFSEPMLATGGNLYADITTGYGPECFTIPSPSAFPYKIQANYYSMGPMGYGMGIVHILRYQPKTGVQSEYRPFVVMQTGATVELGEIKQ